MVEIVRDPRRQQLTQRYGPKRWMLPLSIQIGISQPQPCYLYFVVAQDGSFLIRKRAGDTLNFAVNEVVTARTST